MQGKMGKELTFTEHLLYSRHHDSLFKISGCIDVNIKHVKIPTIHRHVYLLQILSVKPLVTSGLGQKMQKAEKNIVLVLRVGKSWTNFK